MTLPCTYPAPYLHLAAPSDIDSEWSTRVHCVFCMVFWGIVLLGRGSRGRPKRSRSELAEVAWSCNLTLGPPAALGAPGQSSQTHL
jgi:hypothetical protein